jgi:hypothetical protein
MARPALARWVPLAQPVCAQLVVRSLPVTGIRLITPQLLAAASQRFEAFAEPSWTDGKP